MAKNKSLTGQEQQAEAAFAKKVFKDRAEIKVCPIRHNQTYIKMLLHETLTSAS